MGKTRDLVKKIRDTKGTFHPRETGLILRCAGKTGNPLLGGD